MRVHCLCVTGANNSPHTGADDAANGDAFLLQNAKNADVGKASRAAAAKRQRYRLLEFQDRLLDELPLLE